MMVPAMMIPTTTITQTGAPRNSAGAANTAAEITRVTTIVTSAARLPRRHHQHRAIQA